MIAGYGKAKLVLFVFACLFLPFPAQAAAEEGEERLTLQQAYLTALEHNREIASSRENVEQSRHRVDEVASQLYPQIAATGQHTRQKELQEDRMSPTTDTIPGTPEHYSTLSLNLDQHIYQWGRVWSGKRAAEEFLEGTRQGHARNVQEILFQVTSSYYAVLLAERHVEIAESSLKRAERHLEQARSRYEVGVVTHTDVLRAEVQVAQAAEELERARNDMDLALEDLALHMGVMQVERDLAEPEEMRPSRDPDMDELYSRALDNRRDLDQMQRRASALEENVQQQRADYFPRLSAHGSYTRTDEPDIFQDNRENWEASLRLSYPLFQGGRDRAELHKARSELAQSQAELGHMRQQIRNQVRSVHLDIRTQRRVIQQLEKQVESARSHYEQVSAQFEEGVASSVDLVDALTALNEAENRLAQARFDYQLDQVRADLVTGIFQKELVTDKELSP